MSLWIAASLDLTVVIEVNPEGRKYFNDHQLAITARFIFQLDFITCAGYFIFSLFKILRTSSFSMSSSSLLNLGRGYLSETYTFSKFL